MDNHEFEDLGKKIQDIVDNAVNSNSYHELSRTINQTVNKAIDSGSEALKNAMIPIVTVIGLQLGVLLAGSIVTEVIFSINGVGKYLVDSMNARDYAAVQGCVLLIAFVSAILNLIVDIIYTFIDPRMKTMYESSKSGFFRFKKRGEKKAA